MKNNRRTFGKLAAAAALGAPLAARAAPRTRVAAVSDLTPGSPVYFEYPAGHEAIVVQLAEPAEHGVGPGGDIVAFHTTCPHMGCPLISLDPVALAAGVFGPCTCHGSTFDLAAHGRQIHGRATQNLVRVELTVSGDEIYATGIVGLPFGEAIRELV